jgi:hypothetical protein
MSAARVAEDYRWFVSSDRSAPREAFDDVTMVSEVPEVPEMDIEILVEEEPAPVLPTPVRRTSTPLPSGALPDDRFTELNTIVEQTRLILREAGMTVAQLDAIEWKLRERIAKL